jgi:hypothetical protein
MSGNNRNASGTARKKSLQEYVREDKKLEKTTESATLALMELRWNAVNVDGYTQAEYARALGRSWATINRYARAWAIWTEWQEDTSTADRTPLDAYMRAALSEAQFAATEVVADARGITLNTARVANAPEIKRARGIIDAAPDRETGIADARRDLQETGDKSLIMPVPIAGPDVSSFQGAGVEDAPRVDDELRAPEGDPPSI